MAVRDGYRDEWCSDIAAILNTSTSVATSLWTVLKNIECHRILEQYLSEDTQDTFEFIVAPIGKIKMKRNGKEWSLIDVELAESFKKTLNENIRCRESNLYRELYDRNLIRFKKYLERYTQSQRV